MLAVVAGLAFLSPLVPNQAFGASSGASRPTDVNVINTPLPVTVTTTGSSVPFQAQILCRPSGSDFFGCTSYTPLSNVRLVIEQVGASFTPNDATNQVAGVRLSTVVNGVPADQWIEVPSVNTFGVVNMIQGKSQLTKIYSDAGSTVYFNAFVNKASTLLNEQAIDITISGQQISN